MNKIVKFFLFLLDELIFLILLFAILHYLKASFELFVIVFVLVGIALIFISYVFLPQLKQPVTGIEGLIGMKGIALESFQNKGRILVHGEQWNAVTTQDFIKKNDEVIVEDVQGLTVTVKKRE